MPLSSLTRLRAAIIVIAFAISLFWLEAYAFIVLPILLWFLASNAVREAPPFDESAFHRTRPVTPARVFRHLVGFHMLVFATLLIVLLVYAWRMNLGWREIALGTALLGVPWVALVSLFATVSSLSTSAKHWKGWSFVALLLLPAISLFGFFAAIAARWYKEEEEIVVAIPVVAAVLYPALWWLVAVKARWTLVVSLGLASGVALPWIISGIQMLDLPVNVLVEQPQAGGLTIRRLKSSADTEEMMENQASTSRLLEIRGLGPDEFIGGISMYKLREPGHVSGSLEADRNLSDMGRTAFSTDANGLLIPATASLFHVMGLGLENSPAIQFPIWDSRSSGLGTADLAEFLSLPLLSAGRNFNHGNETFDSAERTWSMGANVFRWEKVLDTAAKNGGRARLHGGGVVVMLPIDLRMHQFQITVRSIRGHFQSDPAVSGHQPVLVATGESGIRRFVKCVDTVYASKRGFLLHVRDFQFRAPLSDSVTDGQNTGLENMRLELYWPVFRGSFNATLPPP